MSEISEQKSEQSAAFQGWALVKLHLNLFGHGWSSRLSYSERYKPLTVTVNFIDWKQFSIISFKVFLATQTLSDVKQWIKRQGGQRFLFFCFFPFWRVALT